ncbi:MAG: C69 family dipeptidase [Bacteroidales bacterium]|nr:C69 family dipeptidase [Bacteroidales bacterium]
MKRVVFSLVLAFSLLVSAAQELPADYEGQSCTSIMVGRLATTDGSVITSHTCDGRYRTWMTVEPAGDYAKGALHTVNKGTMHTSFRDDTTGVKVAGTIPQAAHTFAYLNTAYPCLNEKQLAIGETTFSGPDTLVNKNGMFNIEELERVVLMRCSTARDAIHLIGDLIKKYGYGDGGECITIADKKEVWQMEILGEGPDKIGGVWAAQRVPDHHVAVSANIPRIGRLMRENPEYFICSDNIEKVAKKYNLWDGQGDFIFWKAFNAAYANGKNFREREFYIFSTLAPSLGFTMDMDELPFSIMPDHKIDVKDITRLLRSTFEGSELDMCQNVKCVVNKKNDDGTAYKDTVVSPIANPWLGGNMMNTLNFIAPGTVTYRRTVSVAWCSYSFVAQLRDWLPDEVGGVCWMSVDNPGQSPRVPIFSGTTKLPAAYDTCGQKKYNENAVLWKYRKANKLATVAWQRVKPQMTEEILRLEKEAFDGLGGLESKIGENNRKAATGNITASNNSVLLNEYTADIYKRTSAAWKDLEAKYWQMFGLGF